MKGVEGGGCGCGLAGGGWFTSLVLWGHIRFRSWLVTNTRWHTNNSRPEPKYLDLVSVIVTLGGFRLQLLRACVVGCSEPNCLALVQLLRVGASGLVHSQFMAGVYNKRSVMLGVCVCGSVRGWVWWEGLVG